METEAVARELEEALDSLDASSNGQCRKELSQGLVSAGMLLKLTSTHAKRTETQRGLIHGLRDGLLKASPSRPLRLA